MHTLFHDRAEAGRQLARRLRNYGGEAMLLVLALPRGGVPVGYEVARALNAPLDVFIVRKLGVPGQEELAMGAIASGGVRVLNEEVVRGYGISEEVLERVAERETLELARRELAYRGRRPPPEVRGRTVILVDDGVATGASARAAGAALRRLGVGKIVLATPTAAASTVREMRPDVDDLVTVIAPEDFSGVGRWYRNFSETTDEEVRGLLEAASALPYLD